MIVVNSQELQQPKSMPNEGWNTAELVNCSTFDEAIAEEDETKSAMFRATLKVGEIEIYYTIFFDSKNWLMPSGEPLKDRFGRPRKNSTWKVFKFLEAFGLEKKKVGDNYVLDERDAIGRKCKAYLYRADNGYLKVFDVAPMTAGEDYLKTIEDRAKKHTKKASPSKSIGNEEEVPW
jgi:hypothetical protein